MSSQGPIKAVVIAHGAMARGMVDAVRRIAGDSADSLQPLSNEGKSPALLMEELDALAGDGPVLVFVDLQTGSCGMAALSSCRDRARRRVICGVNLAMLLDFVFHRSLPLDDLVARILDKGRGSITQPSASGG